MLRLSPVGSVLRLEEIRHESANGYISSFSAGVYVGRGGKGRAESVVANQLRIGPDGSRAEVIANYRLWLWQRIKANDVAVIAERRRIGDGDLDVVCFCAPKACHGDVVVRAAKWLVDTTSHPTSKGYCAGMDP